MATFYIHNLGCKVNRVEADICAARLLMAGATRADEESAELVIINSCTVTAEADTKTRKAVRHALRLPYVKWVVVTGCAAAIAPEEYRRLDERVVVEPDKGLASARACQLLGLKEQPVSAKYTPNDDAECACVGPQSSSGLQQTAYATDHSGAVTHLRAGANFPTRMGVMIQDGCDNACTYCIVHVARGHSVSRFADTIVAEVIDAAASGVQEVVLTGINIGSYRVTDPVPADFSILLRRLLGETSMGRFRISSIEPLDVTPSVLDALQSADGRICAHIHLPLQSGSDRVLREMARPYSASTYLRIIEELRSRLPHIAITTDVIVGFPGESDADFDKTLLLCEAASFSRIHIFRYSPRLGTLAALRKDQIDSAVKKDRARRLTLLGRELGTLDQEARLGSTEKVLIERVGLGKSESYHDVIDGGTWGDLKTGSLVDMNLKALDKKGRFVGTPIF